MNGWRTEFTPHGRRQLRGIDRQQARRILDALTALQRAMGTNCLDGLNILPLRMNRSHLNRSNGDERARKNPEFRLDVEPFRVVYTCDRGSRMILVTAVGDRKEVYRERGG